MTLTHWRRALEWLAAAAKDPGACREEWEHGSTGVHLLEAGRLWDVLAVPERIGLYAVDRLSTLPAAGRGPVLHDAKSRRVGFLLPPDPAVVWAGHNLRHVTRGGWIAAPAPHCRWGTLRWLCPPDGSGTLTAPTILELLLEQALRDIARTQGSPRRPHMTRQRPTGLTP
ncbi:hypothetical protein [Streptomyces sp. NPDC058739]|uniref:hypothetical protein n=1 Tax=Streptomyces sp. NPDC058739 TaxID=3346618 RepID=UPI00367E9257